MKLELKQERAKSKVTKMHIFPRFDFAIYFL